MGGVGATKKTWPLQVLTTVVPVVSSLCLWTGGSCRYFICGGVFVGGVGATKKTWPLQVLTTVVPLVSSFCLGAGGPEEDLASAGIDRSGSSCLLLLFRGWGVMQVFN